ncbi:MAG: O-antigen ligase family protein [Phaeodactylibacter sp.]|nr:O-antigen ligase family protein [Phaeodactylibacter sp.]MCB9297885.1 O-antigen ligase family protein [Lewinellaceae bacterium]
MMRSKLTQLLDTSDASFFLFRVFAAVLLLCLFAGVASELYFLAGIPAFLLVVYLTIVDFRKTFLLLLACIPLSTELILPNGLGTDLPTEPLMIGLMLVGLAYVVRHGKEADGRFVRHPITLLLFLHLAWLVVAAIHSQEWVVSVKFLLAKTWYVATFFFLAAHLLDGEREIRQFFWAVFSTLLLTVLVVMARHATYGFSFADVYRVLHPFYRNHVAYASIIVVFLPFIWYFRKWYPAYSRTWWLLSISLAVLLLAIQLSYTRAAYVSAVIAIGAFYAIRYRLTRYILLLALAGVLGLVALMAYNNRYLDYAPNYETTVSHQDFNNLLQATYTGEDISTMERVYRWVAGFHMGAERPVFGFGPGNFYNYYKSYTVTSFQTYVSDNPDKSGIHSYYLMTMAEQGLPGLFFFLLLSAYALIRGEVIYHRERTEKGRHIIMMALLSLVIILSLLIINDLIETDKVGPFFFMNLALLINMDLRQQTQAADA